MDWESRISADPDVLVGKPVITGTRLGVAFIIDLLAQGVRPEQILDDYPGIAMEDIQACLHYAAERVAEERVYPLVGG